MPVDAIPLALAAALTLPLLGGCAGPGGSDADGLSGAAEACVRAQRDERQWCSKTVLADRHAGQYRCLDALRRIDKYCYAPR